MTRTLLLSAAILLLVSISSAFPFGEDFGSSAPAGGFENFKKILPSQVTEAYQTLNPQEKQALQEVFRNYRNYHNEQEFIAALKQKSPSLGARAEKMLLQMKRRVAGLSEESKGFVENLLSTGRELYAEHLNGAQIDRSQMRQVMMGIVGQYRSLSPYAQDELKQTFPETFKALAELRAQRMGGMGGGLFQRFFGGGMQ